jgi:hypothetical protein
MILYLGVGLLVIAAVVYAVAAYIVHADGDFGEARRRF